MPTPTRRTLAAALTAAAALLLTGCSSYTDIPGGVAVSAPVDVALAFVDAVGGGDAQGACEHVSLDALGATADECVQLMQGAIDTGVQADTDLWRVRDVVDGTAGDDRTSEVVLEDGDGQRVGSVFLTWLHGEWQITDV